jgi:hypothetical protein
MSADRPPRGQPGLSQSVMLTGADEAGAHFASVRVCQYPEAGVAWLWCTVSTPRGLHQFASNSVPWSGPALPAEDAQAAAYRADAGTALAEFQRAGTLKAPRSASLAARFQSAPVRGRRSALVTIAAEFEPLSGFAGLLPGRTEAFGRARFVVTVAGRRIVFEGPAQFHEQAQTDARFVTPFVFCSLWSKDLFATLLDAPPHSGGYVIDAMRPRGLLTPIAELHDASTTYRFTDAGRPVAIRLDTVQAYRIPIYGRPWQGRFVKGVAFGKPVVGMLNSWDRQSPDRSLTQAQERRPG